MKPPIFKPYCSDWTDRLRDIANIFFLGGYLMLLAQYTVIGAVLYFLGEVFLVPHCVRLRSWSTLFVSSLFAVGSVVTVVSFIMATGILK